MYVVVCVRRFVVLALPSHTMATTGPLVMYSITYSGVECVKRAVSQLSPAIEHCVCASTARKH